MHSHALMAAFVAGAHLLAAVLPCAPSSLGGADGGWLAVRGHAPSRMGARGDHAAGAVGHVHVGSASPVASVDGASGMPCHARDLPEPEEDWRAPCPCGCGGTLPGQLTLRLTLAKSLLTAPLAGLAAPSPILVTAIPAAVPFPIQRSIDHVPIPA